MTIVIRCLSDYRRVMSEGSAALWFRRICQIMGSKTVSFGREGLRLSRSSAQSQYCCSFRGGKGFKLNEYTIIKFLYYCDIHITSPYI